ncbi:Protein NRT1/ PTR FAMILY 4.5 [Glycine soja]
MGLTFDFLMAYFDCNLQLGFLYKFMANELLILKKLAARSILKKTLTMGICRNMGTQPRVQRRLGGNRATLFVYAMEGLENMAFVANAVSLVTYFFGYMNFSLTKSATTLTNFMGTAFLLALVGGLISDTYLSRFKTCVLFACMELLGYGILTVQARFHQLRPIPCKDLATTQMSQCEAATGGHAAILYTGLYLVALGTGGIKAALPALGADQFDEKDPKEATQLSSFFNWFLFSLTIGAIIGVTFIVWIGVNLGWDWSFIVCTLTILFAIVFICMGNSLFLDRAAIARSSTGARTTSGPWRLCTVTQVEETKILVRMLPIILSTIFMNTCLAQLQTFTIQQSTTMDTNLGGFKVPGPSVPVIPLLFMFVLIPLYDRVFVPLARRITGIPTGIRHLQRIGIGLVLSTVSMAVAGFVETRRKSVAIQHNMVDSTEPLPISVFWLGFQYAIFGAADMFTLIGLLEFFYAESSAGMKSLGTAISWSSVAFGYFTSTVVVEVVNKVSGGWLASNNLNRDNLNYFYWLLSVLSVVNFGFYLVCASWYRYKTVENEQGDSKDNVDMAKV